MPERREEVQSFMHCTCYQRERIRVSLYLTTEVGPHKSGNYDVFYGTGDSKMLSVFESINFNNKKTCRPDCRRAKFVGSSLI